MSWERWESSELGRWERCVSGLRWIEVARWERWENNEEAQLERWERNEVAIWEKGRVVSREGRMEFMDKIVLHCSREVKCKHFYMHFAHR